MSPDDLQTGETVMFGRDRVGTILILENRTYLINDNGEQLELCDENIEFWNIRRPRNDRPGPLNPRPAA